MRGAGFGETVGAAATATVRCHTFVTVPSSNMMSLWYSVLPLCGVKNTCNRQDSPPTKDGRDKSLTTIHTHEQQQQQNRTRVSSWRINGGSAGGLPPPAAATTGTAPTTAAMTHAATLCLDIGPGSPKTQFD